MPKKKVNHTPIRTEKQFNEYLRRLEEIFDSKKGDRNSDEAELLSIFIEDYEDRKLFKSFISNIPNWINIKDKKPKAGQEALCWNGQKVVLGIYDKRQDPKYPFRIQKYPGANDRSIVAYWTNVTHWLPLPKSPRRIKK